MNRRLFGLALVALMIVASCQKNPDLESIQPDLKKAQVEESDYKVIPGQYIVVLNEFPAQPKGKAVGYEEGIARARQVIQGLMNENRIPANKLGFVYAFALEGFSATLTEEEMIRLARDKRVKYVEPDQEVSINVAQTPATWGLDRIDQRNLPLNSTYNYESTGTGVTAYILDTGIRTAHNEFGGRARQGFDAFGGNSEDCNGHGTHVAGTVGGATYGVAKNVSLVAVRVLDCNGSGTWSGVIAGMDWVVSNHTKPAVVNMSLGGGASTSIDDAVARLFNAGVPVIVAAGNENKDACLYSPARASRSYSVGATTNTDARASYSNFGNCVNIFAPGSSITSAYYTSNTATAIMSGTSMASPHVAGAAALFLQSNPNASPQQVYEALSASSTKGIVTSAKTTNNHLLYTLGFEGIPPQVNQPPVANFTFTTSGLTARFNASYSSDPDGSIVNYAWNFGDGTSGSGITTSRTYANGGTYTVTLTVTDNAGATNAVSKDVQVSAPVGNISLTAVKRIAGVAYADLTWSNAIGANVMIKVNGTPSTSLNDGFESIKLGKVKSGTTYTFQVCETDGNRCSNIVSLTY